MLESFGRSPVSVDLDETLWNINPFDFAHIFIQVAGISNAKSAIGIAKSVAMEGKLRESSLTKTNAMLDDLSKIIAK